MEQKLESDQFDIGVIASFGKMVPDRIIDAFPQGMLVMHPSLLPKYRGACPIQHAILNQDDYTGTSVIEIAKGVFDAGDILAQSKQVAISKETRFSGLSVELAELGGELLGDILIDGKKSLDRFRETRVIQSTEASKAPMVKQ